MEIDVIRFLTATVVVLPCNQSVEEYEMPQPAYLFGIKRIKGCWVFVAHNDHNCNLSHSSGQRWPPQLD